jgi:hypothetical protein
VNNHPIAYPNLEDLEMQTAWRKYNAILRLETEPFLAIKQAQDGLWWALKLFFVISLILGLGKWVALGEALGQATLAEQVQTLASQVERTGTQVEQAGANMTGLSEQLLGELIRGIGSFLTGDVTEFLTGLETQVIALEPPLGVRPSRIVKLFGDWLSTPFQLMANWLPFTLLVLVIAKLWGGQGTLREHLSLAALAVAPQLLAVLTYVPPTSVMGIALGIFGQTLSLVAVIWSLAILLKAVAIAHEIELKKSALILIGAFVVLYIALPIALIMVPSYILFR